MGVNKFQKLYVIKIDTVHPRTPTTIISVILQAFHEILSHFLFKLHLQCLAILFSRMFQAAHSVTGFLSRHIVIGKPIEQRWLAV